MKCLDCKKRKIKALFTRLGILLCDDCYLKQKEKYAKYGGVVAEREKAMNKAEKMINETDLSIAEIARRTDLNAETLRSRARKMERGA